jgi:5-methylcytosine-specific restriction endonuclease McrA
MKTVTTLSSLFTNLSNNTSSDNAALGVQKRTFSAEHRRKIGDAQRGKPKSEAQKQKQRAVMLGRKGQSGSAHSQWKGGISKTKEYRYRKHREWSARNLEKTRAYQRKRYALKRNAAGAYSADDWDALKTALGGMCVCCKRTDVKLEADHIIPLSKGCNARKNNRHIDYRVEVN